MFTIIYNELELQRNAKEKYFNAQVPSEAVEITSKNISMFLLQSDQVNNFDCDDSNQFTSKLEHSLKLLLVLEKYLDKLFILKIEDDSNIILGHSYESTSVNKLKQIQSIIHKTKNDNNRKVINQRKSLHCLFTWDLQPSASKKNIIKHIKTKYSNFDFDISLPVFRFERYISNIIIAYELFHKGKKLTALIIILFIGKWLEELDDSNDELYLLMRNGLKHVLISTFICMNKTKIKSFENMQWLYSFVVPYCNMNNESKAAVHAIQAAVLIEYSNHEDSFNKAIECAKIACDLNPINCYWFYLYSLVLTAQRNFLQTYKSYPTETEKNAIQKAIELSDIQNINIMYHEIMLFKNTVLHKFHSNKNKNKYFNNKHLHDTKILVQMINKLLSMEPEDPLIVVNCARILTTLPGVVHDSNLIKQLLIKGLNIAPNDLIVLKAITRVIIINKKETKKNSSSIINQSFQNQLSKENLYDDLKLANEKHNSGKDPIPYLMGILINYEYQIQWKILAQICSYTILFSNNFKTGVEYFLMLVEAEQNGLINSDLILCHYSSFIHKSKKFNLAKLIHNEIKLHLIDTTLQEKQHYFNVLAKILYIYGIENEDVDRYMRSNLIDESRLNIQQEIHSNNQNVNPLNKNINTRSRSRSRSRNRSRSSRNRNHQNNANVNQNNTENDELSDNDDISIKSNNTTNCCCMIM